MYEGDRGNAGQEGNVRIQLLIRGHVVYEADTHFTPEANISLEVFRFLHEAVVADGQLDRLYQIKAFLSGDPRNT